MTSADIRTALRARFTSPEWAIFFEVGDGTGAQHRRWADAVAMNLWPSRGLSINGFEIKVSRSDWRSELKNPAKSEPVQQYCDYWWIVAPAGIVPKEELPDTWGLFEVSPSGKIKQVVAAPKLTPKPVTRPFMAALLRRAGQVEEDDIRKAVAAKTESIREEFQKSFERNLDIRTQRHKEVYEKIAKIKEATGIDLLNWTPTKEVASAIKFVLSVGVLDTYSGIDRMRNGLRSALDHIDGALDEFQKQKDEILVNRE